MFTTISYAILRLLINRTIFKYGKKNEQMEKSERINE